MSSSIKYVTIVAFAASVAACATHYKPALTGQPQARVRMLSSVHKIAWAAVLKDQCIAQTTFGWEATTEQIGVVTARENPKRTSIGMPLPAIPADAAFIETWIPAGQPVALGFSSLGMFHAMACGAGLIFTPQNGADYQVTYQPQSDSGCSTKVELIRQNETGEVLLEDVENSRPVPTC